VLVMLRSLLGRLRGNTTEPMARWDDDPLVTAPQADAATYLALFETARTVAYPEIDALEAAIGHAIERDWLDELALHTQVVIKQSELNYQHGRVLYAVLGDYLATKTPGAIHILETGTARGFSALCMARALADAGTPGCIVSLDVLPHMRPIYWNCIDDCEGRKTRESLLAPWRDLLEPIMFLQGDTRQTLRRLALARVHFAFLDAQHSYEAVIEEAAYVMARQQPGDVIVFDDVTATMFPGVVAAVDEIERQHPYAVQRVAVSDQRGYAIATRQG
jgi:predicted O-methyltransferase YrrM